MLKAIDFARILCDFHPQDGIIEGDGPGEAQVRSGLQRIFASNMTNNPGREDRADKPESIQQPFWRSQPNSCGQRANTRIILMQD